jgi:ribosomal-protein-alanine N-acetyltransferase
MKAMTVTRPLTPGDADTVAELLRVNRDFLAPWEPVRDDEYYTAHGQLAVIEGALARPDSVHPRVILNEAGRVAGRITLSEIIRGPVQSCSLGYWVSAGDNGRGLATAAVGEVIAVAFSDLGLHRIQAGTLTHNVRSQRVLERNGFTRIGMAPAYLNIAGRWQDHILFQVVAEQAG